MRFRFWFICTILILFVVTACRAETRRLQPLIETSTPVGLINQQPLQLTFAELNADAFNLNHSLIRIAGTYQRLNPVVCTPYKGPRPQWELISNDLRMNVVGLNDRVKLAPQGATFVVDGVWRLYEGPVGCGKEPATQRVFYLEARRIIQPNPFAFDDTMIDVAVVQQGETTPTPQITPTVAIAEPTLTITPTASPTSTPTASPTSNITATATLINTAPTIAIVTPTNTPPAGTPTLVPTAPPGSTATPTPTPTNTPSGGSPTPTQEGGSVLPTSPASPVSPSTPEATNTPTSYGGGGDDGGY